MNLSGYDSSVLKILTTQQGLKKELSVQKIKRNRENRKKQLKIILMKMSNTLILENQTMFL